MILIHAAGSYFNLNVLFQNLLKRKQYLFYIVSVILTIILGCVLLAIAFYSVDTISPSSKRNIWSMDFFTANSISLSYTLAITMSLKMVKQWYERERDTQKLERVNMETELKYLKSQINPHFLFNSLNSLYALTLKKSDLAPELVLKLSDILRYVLYEGSARWVELNKEINYINSYLELEKMRHGERLDVRFSVDGDLNSKRIAPMLFLTFLENSFKHGISQTAENGFLNIDMQIDEFDLKFSICNSKPKQKEERINGNKGGIGIENVKKRLKLLYPDRHELIVNEDDNTYCVQLVLDIEPFNNPKLESYEMHDRR